MNKLYILVYEKQPNSTHHTMRFTRPSYAVARAKDMLAEGWRPLAITELDYEIGQGMEAVAA
jgi:hypothetical protein